MIIAVASGKGGTGKTLIATNLAQTLGKGVQFVDCDVEEPNGHLFLKPEIRETRQAFVPVPGWTGPSAPAVANVQGSVASAASPSSARACSPSPSCVTGAAAASESVRKAR